ncbi:hypothetical protein ES705_39032 [subsurface metagenome]
MTIYAIALLSKYMKSIVFHPHAKEKMNKRGISKNAILETLKSPKEVVNGGYGRKIAQKVFGRYLIRVIFEEYEDYILVITIYLTKPKRYVKRI